MADAVAEPPRLDGLVEIVSETGVLRQRAMYELGLDFRAAGMPPMIRVDGDMKRINMPALTHKDVKDGTLRTKDLAPGAAQRIEGFRRLIESYRARIASISIGM